MKKRQRILLAHNFMQNYNIITLVSIILLILSYGNLELNVFAFFLSISVFSLFQLSLTFFSLYNLLSFSTLFYLLRPPIFPRPFILFDYYQTMTVERRTRIVSKLYIVSNWTIVGKMFVFNWTVVSSNVTLAMLLTQQRIEVGIIILTELITKHAFTTSQYKAWRWTSCEEVAKNRISNKEDA